MEKVIQRRAKSGKDEHSKKENKYMQAPEDFEETEVVEEEALEELEEKELFGGKNPKKKRPKKKMNKTIFWVIGILTFLILIFELLTIHRIMANQFNEEPKVAKMSTQKRKINIRKLQKTSKKQK